MSVEGFTNKADAQGLGVFRADDFRVSNGANLGDPVADAGDMMLDDIYQLSPNARSWRLNLAASDGLAHLTVLEGAQIGTYGAAVHLDCCATFMAPDGSIVEALVLVELAPGTELIAATYLLPLAKISPRTDYALVSVDTDTPRQKFAGLACVSFTRGTHITMASGAQCPIEDIRVGDRVLTRDNGVQEVRWIGQQTVRATGAFAPIVLAPGAMNNSGELRLSPNQRLFVYQREDRLGAGRAEVVVKADFLVNDDTVTRSDGGFVDYYQILFDHHEFIYAEGIATESLTVDMRTSPALPREVQDKLGLRRSNRATQGRPDPFDIGEGMLDAAIAADILRRASSV
ncbi:MAG: Hint domain-containing protein [Rhodobacter sp.]|nr:Hint domain-containing protein [Rhodobacter sp.]